MNLKLIKTSALVVFLSAAVVSVSAQDGKSKELPKSGEPAINQPAAKTISIKPDATPLELAKIALQAHGGEKFRNAKNFKVDGSVDVTSGNFPQSIKGAFVMIFAGDKYRLQIQTPMMTFTQTSDGQQTYSSVGNVDVPPINRLGLPLLLKIEQTGYTVSALPDKKKRGFRISSPEGYATDFLIDEKTGLVKSYTATFSIRGREATTAVEHDKFRTVDGVVMPEKYSQRFDIGQTTFYADFKVKDLAVNAAVSDDVFVLQ